MTDVSLYYRKIIPGICSSFDGCRYLEVGVDDATTLQGVIDNGNCSYYTWVDIRQPPTSVEGYLMSSDEFFSTYEGEKFHVIFIDADHDYNAAKKDFENSVKLLHDGGIILLDDTWPVQGEDINLNSAGTVYKLAQDITNDDRFESITITSFSGLTMVRVKGSQYHKSEYRSD